MQLFITLWFDVTQATDGYLLALYIAERGIFPGHSSAYMDMELSTLECNSKKKIADEGLSVNFSPLFGAIGTRGSILNLFVFMVI